MNMIETNKSTAVTPFVQLSYVLPRQSLNLLPQPIYKYLLREKGDWYPTDCTIMWAFCKYFWESHVELPSINLEELEKIVDEKNGK